MIESIQNEDDYDAALLRIDELVTQLDPEIDTPDDELSHLCAIVVMYEDEHYPIHSPDPMEDILFHLEQFGAIMSNTQKIQRKYDLAQKYIRLAKTAKSKCKRKKFSHKAFKYRRAAEQLLKIAKTVPNIGGDECEHGKKEDPDPPP